MIVDTNAYKLQPSLSERVIFDGHGCHTALHLVSKLKKIKTKFLRCNGYLNSIKNPIKQDLLLILVLVRQQNFLNCKSRVLQLLKNMPLWKSVIVLCFVVRYFMSILVLQSS